MFNVEVVSVIVEPRKPLHEILALDFPLTNVRQEFVPELVYLHLLCFEPNHHGLLYSGQLIVLVICDFLTEESIARRQTHLQYIIFVCISDELIA